MSNMSNISSMSYISNIYHSSAFPICLVFPHISDIHSSPAFPPWCLVQLIQQKPSKNLSAIQQQKQQNPHPKNSRSHTKTQQKQQTPRKKNMCTPKHADIQQKPWQNRAKSQRITQQKASKKRQQGPSKNLLYFIEKYFRRHKTQPCGAQDLDMSCGSSCGKVLWEVLWESLVRGLVGKSCGRSCGKEGLWKIKSRFLAKNAPAGVALGQEGLWKIKSRFLVNKRPLRA